MDLRGRSVEVPPEGKVGTVVGQEPCKTCSTSGRVPCGYDDVIVEFEDGTRERHYEPEVIARHQRPSPLSFEQTEVIARAFHDTYERLAPGFGYRTRKASAVPWAEVPEDNKRLMCATVRELHDQGVLGITDRTRGSVLSPEHQQQEERMQEEETTFGTAPVETPDTLTGETEGSPAEPESPQEEAPESAPEPESEAEPEPESDPAEPEAEQAEPEADDAPAEESESEE